MPTYQYACTNCGHRFDAVQSFSDDSLTECPQCAGRLRKLFGAVGVVFKGSGFYRTDSRSEAKSGSTKSTTDAAASTGSSSATKSESSAASGSSSSGSSTASSTTSSASSSSATKAAP